jgi:threonine/homoserine/homoserine lactone efflux protein
MENIAAYLSAIMILMIIPGQDMAYVIANGIAYGKRGAAMAALGLCFGGLVWTSLLWAVLHFAIAITPEALIYIQYAGGCHLIYLAFQLSKRPSPSASRRPEIPPMSKLIFRGALTNLSNPKVSIFFFAFIPPFVPPTSPDPALYAFGLGAILIVVGGATNFAFGITGGLFQDTLLSGRIKGRPIANLILAALFGIIGLSIFLFRLF